MAGREEGARSGYGDGGARGTGRPVRRVVGDELPPTGRSQRLGAGRRPEPRDRRGDRPGVQPPRHPDWVSYLVRVAASGCTLDLDRARQLVRQGHGLPVRLPDRAAQPVLGRAQGTIGESSSSTGSRATVDPTPPRTPSPSPSSGCSCPCPGSQTMPRTNAPSRPARSPTLTGPSVQVPHRGEGQLSAGSASCRARPALPRLGGPMQTFGYMDGSPCECGQYPSVRSRPRAPHPAHLGGRHRHRPAPRRVGARAEPSPGR